MEYIFIDLFQTNEYCIFPHRYNSTPASPSETRLAARVELSQRHNSSPDTGLVGDHASKMYIHISY